MLQTRAPVVSRPAIGRAVRPAARPVVRTQALFGFGKTAEPETTSEFYQFQVKVRGPSQTSLVNSRPRTKQTTVSMRMGTAFQYMGAMHDVMSFATCVARCNPAGCSVPYAVALTPDLHLAAPVGH